MSGPLSLSDPLFRSLLFPFAVSVFSIGVIRLLLGEGRGAVLSNAGIGIGLIAGMLAIFGWPDWPADGLVAKSMWLAMAGLGVGIIADRFQPALPLAMLLIIGWPVLSLLWLVAPDLGHLSSGVSILRLGGLIIGSVLLFVRLDQEQDHGQHAPLLMLWCALGLCGMAFVYNWSKVTELSAVVAAAVAGYLIWNIPVTRYPIGHAALLSVGAILITLATALMVAHMGAGIGLIFIVAILFSERISPLLMGGKPATMLTLNLGAAIPAILAAAAAFLTR